MRKETQVQGDPRGIAARSLARSSRPASLAIHGELAIRLHELYNGHLTSAQKGP